MPPTRLFFFGPVRVKKAAHEDIEISLTKGRALLAYLMVTARPHNRDALATMLWPESDGSRARASLRRVLYHLNQNVGEELLLATGDTIARNPDADVWLDVEVFRQHVAAYLDNHTHPTEVCLEELKKAAALYEDEFLAGFTLPDSPAFDEWQFFEREALRADLSRVLIRLAEAFEESSDWDAAIGATRRWLALDPLHERAHRHLMRLYALSGQRSAAVRQYEECERILDEELGVKPEAKTTSLFEAIRTRQLGPISDEIAASGRSEPWKRATPAVSNLPVDTTAFIGREDEIAEVVSQLSDPACRLLTLAGPGGVGKTRLAIEVARQVAPTFPDGVAFVNLQPLQSADFLVSAIAEALEFNLGGAGDPETQLLGHLSDKALLLLLDNFEHLLQEEQSLYEESVGLLKRLLAAAPGVRLLVTSRQLLSLREEWRYPVPGLPVPVSAAVDDLLAYGAVELFVERARRMRPGFSLEEERPGVVRICQLVDGMPLALELAASWLATLHPLAIASEIQLHLNFLSTSLRDVPHRHRSMHAVFKHSWELLGEDERHVFKRLSVFRGGFDRGAAQAVADASLSTLSSLVDKSLIRRESGERYQVHELLRQYGEAYLSEDPAEAQAVGDRHASHYARFLEERLDELQRIRRRKELEEVRNEWDNVRAAWRWAIEHARLDDLSQAAAPFYYFCQTQSRFVEGAAALAEGVSCLRALAPGEGRDVLLARMLCDRGWIDVRLGQLASARRLLEESWELYRVYDPRHRASMGADPRSALGALELVEGNFAAASVLGEALRRDGEEQEDGWSLMFAYYVLGNAASAQGDYARARKWTGQAIEVGQRLEARWFLAFLLNDLGNVAHLEREYAQAEEYYRQSFLLREEQSDPGGMADALYLLGSNAIAQDNHEEAQTLLRRAAVIYRRIGDQGGLARSLNGLGQSASVFEENQAAGDYFREALQISGDVRFLPLTCSILLNIADLLLQLGETREGLLLLDVVRHHEASDHATQERAQQQFATYRQQLPDDAFLSLQPKDELPTLEALLPRLHVLLPTNGANDKPT